MTIFWTMASRLMDKNGIKQVELARLTGKNKSSVSDWIKYDILPKVDDALRIADLLGVSVRFLVTGVDETELPMLEKQIMKLCHGLPDKKLRTIIKVVKDIREDWEEEKGDQDSLGTSDSEARS